MSTDLLIGYLISIEYPHMYPVPTIVVKTEKAAWDFIETDIYKFLNMCNFENSDIYININWRTVNIRLGGFEKSSSYTGIDCIYIISPVPVSTDLERKFMQ